MPSSPKVPEALQQVDVELRSAGIDSHKVAWELLQGVRNTEASSLPVVALKKKVQCEGDSLERLLVWRASQRAIAQVGSLPIHDSVRERLEQDLRQLHSMSGPLGAGTYHFNRAAKLATLRRFPAGPMEWEESGIPISFFLQASFPDNLRLLAFVKTRMGGRAPCFFMHIAPSPRNRALSVPKQVLKSYYRMAASLRLQPDARGLIAHAWFHDPAAVRDNPQLEVLSHPYREAGGLIVTLGTAPPSSGVLIGNEKRKADYTSGKIRYRYGLAIWPRDEAIQWAEAHPELEQ